jgi:hypothetical protein
MATISAGQLMTFAEQEALAQVFRKTNGPATSSTYLALLTNAATGSVDNTWTTMASVAEYGAGGYARLVLGPTTPTVASPSVISNTGSLPYDPMTGPGHGVDDLPATPIKVIHRADGSGTTAKLIWTYLLANTRRPLVGDSLVAAASSFTCQV